MSKKVLKIVLTFLNALLKEKIMSIKILAGMSYMMIFFFMHSILPIKTPKDDEYSWAYTSEFYVLFFEYDIWEWAELGPYKEDFKTNKKLVIFVRKRAYDNGENKIRY